MIKASINLAKVNKEKLFTSQKGEKWLNIVIWENDEPDKFGNTHAIQQSFSAEDRKAGIKAPYIGNGKAGGGKGNDAPAAPAKKVADDDVPF